MRCVLIVLVMWLVVGSYLWGGEGVNFSKLTVYNKYHDAAEARKSCGVDPVKVRQAIKAFEVLLDAYADSPYSAEAYYEIGQLYELLKDFPQALGSYQQVVNRFPGSDFCYKALWEIGMHRGQDKDYQGAIGAFEMYVNSFPTNPECPQILQSIANYRKALNDKEGAIAALGYLVANYTNSSLADNAIFEIGQHYEGLGEYPTAIEYYNKLMVGYPYSELADDSLFHIAQCYRMCKQYDQAMNTYDRLINDFPGSSLVKSAKQEMNAICDRVIYDLTEEEHTAQAQYDEAKRLQNGRRYFEAIRGYRALVDLFPGGDLGDDAIYEIGQCYEDIQLVLDQMVDVVTPEERAQVVAEWHRVSGGYVPMPGEKGAKSLPDAIAAYRFLLDNYVGSDLCDKALYQIGQCYEKLKQEKEAAVAYAELINRYPDSGYFDKALKAVIKHYEKEGESGEAVELYKSIYTNFPHSPGADDALLASAAIYMGGGDFGTARLLLAQFLQYYPYSELSGGALLIKRVGFEVREFNIRGGKCPCCGLKIPGIWK